MKITFYGHAAFKVETNGTRIIMDPYKSPECKYDPIDDEADIVTICDKDEYPFHAATDDIRGNFEVLYGLDAVERPRTIKGITFHGIKTYELEDRVQPNAMIHFTVEGVHLCHMGDCGIRLEEEHIAPIRHVDVLLALAGGERTIALDALKDAIDRIQPRLIIPMHYRTEKLQFAEPVDEFLSYFPADEVEQSASSSVEITPQSLPSSRRVLVLRYAR
ncbi:MAG: MBL fold metallo-hydrolase [Candidatus Latescibacteria bacterium]|nr:MBL fold metallo-hydrolase [Candidatus Latescibacterota bacterium]